MRPEIGDGDGAITEIDRGDFLRGFGLGRRRHGVVVILFAHGIDAHQRLVTFRQQLRLHQTGVRAVEAAWYGAGSI